MTNKGKLVLLANFLHQEEDAIEKYLPSYVIEKVASLDGLIVESEKSARSFMKKFPFPEGKSFRDMPLRVLCEHTQEQELSTLIAPVKNGQTWGLLSDAGLPCIADPGCKLVYLARRLGLDVEATVGPSAIVLSLMLSGLGGQKFCFEGYLPKESSQAASQIKALYARAKREGSTHLFIETPYRSQQVLDLMIHTLEDTARLSVSIDLTLPTERTITRPIWEWKKHEKIDVNKKLCVFVFAA